MIKRIFLSIVIIITITNINAEEGLYLYLDFGIHWNWGHSNYYLEHTAEQTTVSSLLEFPLDYPLIGAETGLIQYDKAGKDFSLNAGFYMNVMNPLSVMKDSDWIEKSGQGKYMFSYTESTVNPCHSVLAFGKINKKIFSIFSLSFLYNVGYQFQRIYQDIMGYQGWQIDLDTGELSDIQGTEEAMEYWIIYHRPFTGLMINIAHPDFPLSLEIDSNYMFIYIYDFDDHVLRNKESTAEGIGHGFYSSFKLLFQFIKNPIDINPYISLNGNLYYIFTPAKQRQEWYGDDPASSGDDTGYYISDISHEVNSLQFDIGLNLGFSYSLYGLFGMYKY